MSTNINKHETSTITNKGEESKSNVSPKLPSKQLFTANAQTPAGAVVIKTVASKSRVAQLKKITVPRLELGACQLYCLST
ncbi:hypothetical protein NPIL_629191 [Nephila pilipes]|uniref:Uncharacterized protein n=1 Tax=Nephila pilipes TaxID=299642 RepID=A0A8X6N929_NEPPI|nr:hypothetical protein NPIL_629191 [Nephila pilipes]